MSIHTTLQIQPQEMQHYLLPIQPKDEKNKTNNNSRYNSGVLGMPRGISPLGYGKGLDITSTRYNSGTT